MSVKVGDTVRYLNAVGGGRVLRIADGIAYVDEDGFETPVLVRECVAVGIAKFDVGLPVTEHTDREHDDKPRPVQLPVVETVTGDKLNIVLGFEATDIKALSRSDFEAYLVNDSNYYIYVSVCTRAASGSEWTPRYDGVIEPNIQEFLFEMPGEDLPGFDRILVQYLAFKRGKNFVAKRPGWIDMKVDATKFAKLHCFRPNPYFDAPVIAFDIAVNDSTPEMPELDAAALARGIRDKKRDMAHDSKPVQSKPSKESGDTIVVDLHASELLDSTAGLSPSDILNMQIDRFCEVMDANRHRYGQRIVFIHGKGEGVLRQAIMKELTHRYKGHDVQDASFREYGYGATQVTIRRIDMQRGGLTANKKRR